LTAIRYTAAINVYVSTVAWPWTPSLYAYKWTDQWSS